MSDEDFEVTDKQKVDKVTTYQTIVDDMASAWEFIFTRIGEMGDAPRVEIQPLMMCGMFTTESVVKFQVTITGRWEE